MPDDHHTIFAASERLDKVVLSFRQALSELDANDGQKFNLTATLAELDVVAQFLRSKKNHLAETQP